MYAVRLKFKSCHILNSYLRNSKSYLRSLLAGQVRNQTVNAGWKGVTMEYNVLLDTTKYKVESATEDVEAVAVVIKALELFYDMEIEYKAKKEQYEIARYRIEKMFEKGCNDFGLKKIDGESIKVTYIPGSEGTTKVEHVLNESKAKAILEELGVDESEYMDVVSKTTNKRKGSIRVVTE